MFNKGLMAFLHQLSFEILYAILSLWFILLQLFHPEKNYKFLQLRLEKWEGYKPSFSTGFQL